MRRYFTIILLLTFNVCFSQTRLDSMISLLRQPDLCKIFSIKDSIDYYQKDAISKLINLTKDTSFIKLECTTHHDYSASTTYHGHGVYIFYYLDWVCDRTAWIIEAITFQDFGYSEWSTAGVEIMNEYKVNHPNEIYKKDKNDIDFKDSSTREQFKKYRLFLADSVIKWWDKNKNTWTKYNALKEALSSKNQLREFNAINYLENGTTSCDGLTLDNYNSEIKPLLKKIKKRNWLSSDNAKSILKDKEFNWYKIKVK